MRRERDKFETSSEQHFAPKYVSNLSPNLSPTCPKRVSQNLSQTCLKQLPETCLKLVSDLSPPCGLQQFPDEGFMQVIRNGTRSLCRRKHFLLRTRSKTKKRQPPGQKRPPPQRQRLGSNGPPKTGLQLQLLPRHHRDRGASLGRLSGPVKRG